MSSSSPAQPWAITAVDPALSDVVNALEARAFGPGRFAKTAYRIREIAAPVPDLGRIAVDKGTVVGSIAYSRIAIGETPALLLGPLVVAPDRAGLGIGKALMTESLAAATAGGHRLVLLVGDLPYYARVGFIQVATGQVHMPGPVDPERLLWKPLSDGADAGVAGRVAGIPHAADQRPSRYQVAAKAPRRMASPAKPAKSGKVDRPVTT